MSRENLTVHELFVPMHEIQIPSEMFYQMSDFQSTSTALPTYKLEVGTLGEACGENSNALPPVSFPQHLLHPNRNNQNVLNHRNKAPFSEESEMESREHSPASMRSKSGSSVRKSSPSSFGMSSTYDEEGDDSSTIRSEKRQNHSEIEKRRRDKMNKYISELSSMVPTCAAMSRKLDKLTVLRMAVQHLRSVHSALNAGPLKVQPVPPYISEQEINNLVLKAAEDSFIIVVGCDRGRLLHVSKSITKMLYYDKSELLGQSFFDILHPKDVAKVKEQLSCSDLIPRERFIDTKTMMPVKSDVVGGGVSRFGPGARRSFFCRIRCRPMTYHNVPSSSKSSMKTSGSFKEAPEPPTKLRKKHHPKKYCVVQCTGYLKAWSAADVETPGGSDASTDDGDANLMCLVAVGRALTDITPKKELTPASRPIEYLSRHATDGKFHFVDQRVTLAIGYSPQDLLGTSLYEYVDHKEMVVVAKVHKAVLMHRTPMVTPPYTFKRKDGTFAKIQTHFKPFRNPWTKEMECLVGNNKVVVANYIPTGEASDIDELENQADIEMKRLIDSKIESHKIGATIAEEVLNNRPPPDMSPGLPADLLQDVLFNQPMQVSLIDSMLTTEGTDFPPVLNNVPLSSATAPSPTPDMPTPSTRSAPDSPINPLQLDGNGEAAMAVIMSLLEADAGLGGPINFSSLPWPLP